MRIGIDARFLGPESKGLGRHSYKLIKSLEHIDQTNDYFIFLRQSNYDQFVPQNQRFHKVLADIPWYSLEEQITFPRLLNSYNLDLMHFLHFNVPLRYRRPFIVTIHDLILLDYPTRKNSTRSWVTYYFKHKAYKKVIRNAAKQSEHVITTSEFTKQKIQNYFRIPDEKIIPIYGGIDTQSFTQQNENAETTDQEQVFRRFSIEPHQYLLYVGNAYPHKNIEGLLRVFAKLIQKPQYRHWKLVLVGKEDYFYQRVKAYIYTLQIQDNVILTGFVSDHVLSELYKNAGVFVFPSLYEGFGFPPLEALSWNAPVLVSNQTSLPEVCGKAAEYFDPFNEENWVIRLQETIDNLAQVHEYQRRHAPDLLRQYSWETMAKETLDVYNTVKKTKYNTDTL